jgi:hypothetical protein
MRRLGHPAARPGLQLTAKSESLPAPVGGLNTRDPLAVMSVEYGVNMTNFIATPQGATVREGYQVRNTGLPGYVETLAGYTATVAGTDKLFAWSGTGIYDVTSAGAVGAAVVTGLSNARWKTVNFATIGGQFLVCANGVDAVRHYNGSSWVTWTTTGSPANPGEVSTTNSPNLTTWVNPIVHQRRLWFVQTNSATAWYLPINSIGGVATQFDFGPAFPRGGRLVALASWSVEGGDGLKNFLVAASENGDVVIYTGTDPSSATTWTIEATWRLAAPTTADCFFQFGGDVLYLSVDGLMPLTQYMQSTNTAVALSDAIRPTLAALSYANGSLNGWQIHDVLSKNLLILNVPQINPMSNVQFAYNTITKGWSLFTGWPAQCWATLNNIVYFGGYQQVCVAFAGFKDGAASDGTGGAIYTATAQQAFTYLENRARQKHFKLARLNLVSASPSPNFQLAVNTDFDTTPPANIGAAVPVVSSLWDVATWDSGTWAGSISNYNAWQSVANAGYCVSVIIAVSVLAETTWVSTDLIFEVGGVTT